MPCVAVYGTPLPGKFSVDSWRWTPFASFPLSLLSLASVTIFAKLAAATPGYLPQQHASLAVTGYVRCRDPSPANDRSSG